MRLQVGYIPRLYAPLRTLTRQSFGPSPALTTVRAATATTKSNSRSSTSSGSQSKAMGAPAPEAPPGAANGSAAAASAAGGRRETQNQKVEDGSHRGHHPTESTSPAPENATSNAPAADSSNADSSQRQPDAQGSAESAQQKQAPALPPLPAPSSDGNSAGGNGTITLDMSGGEGASTKLDHLGPLVVNQDGTMSRIGNWGEMTEIERRNTLRILGKRNQIRLAGLRGRAMVLGTGPTEAESSKRKSKEEKKRRGSRLNRKGGEVKKYFLIDMRESGRPRRSPKAGMRVVGPSNTAVYSNRLNPRK
ncbi:uncharacterized protein ColSpa_10074 [Colletotrichum spaethianum]|uniref:Uncharacterized protein n=1 Tax=Colletotrichum spaethianum TaxID=700344 RepID=A0AA37USH5_9PEZI|nr:uncharacterized protein ColSpa_10074 [Colletotrichum spaethianum]GKT49893.1 hypothetical protein ColSpa_10074 [Colletotrichum spaethianum]